MNAKRVTNYSFSKLSKFKDLDVTIQSILDNVNISLLQRDTGLADYTSFYAAVHSDCKLGRAYITLHNVLFC